MNPPTHTTVVFVLWYERQCDAYRNEELAHCCSSSKPTDTRIIGHTLVTAATDTVTGQWELPRPSHD